MIAQALIFGFRIGEISYPTRYFKEASSINFKRSVKYGMGVLKTTAGFVAHMAGIKRIPLFDAREGKVTSRYHLEATEGPRVA